MKPEDKCDHGVRFPQNPNIYAGLSVAEIRKRYPRHYGKCPLGCGFEGIAYASTTHYICGDW